MFLDKNSLIIDGIPNVSKYILQVKYGYNKMWGNDTGRNLKASFTGSYIGVIPKLEITFGKTNQEDLEMLANVLDEATQYVTYYDPKLKRMYRMQTYTGDWSTLNKRTFSNNARANESFTISFIAAKVRPLI